jgi:hypothetical protein
VIKALIEVRKSIDLRVAINLVFETINDGEDRPDAATSYDRRCPQAIARAAARSLDVRFLSTSSTTNPERVARELAKVSN